MRPNAAEKRETLDAAALPPEFNTELNHRTCVTTAGEDTVTLLRLLFVPALVVTPAALAAHFMGTNYTLFTGVPLGLAMGLLVFALIRFAFTNRLPEAVAWAALLLACGLLAGLMGPFQEQGSAYLVLFTAALAFAWGLSHFVAKQAAYWMAAHPLVPGETMHAWQQRFPPWQIKYQDPELPESANLLIGLYALAVAWVFAFCGQRIFLHTSLAIWSGPLALLVFVASLIIVCPLFAAQLCPRPAGALATLWRAYEALRTFACYNRHGIPAAGVFRFPTKRLRSTWSRDVVLFAAMLLFVVAIVSISMSAKQPPGSQLAGPPPSEPEPQVDLDPLVWDLINSREGPERDELLAQARAEQLAPWRAEQAAQQQAYANQVHARRYARVAQVLITAVVAVLAAPILLLLVVWVSTGQLLALYYDMLEAPGAPEHSSLTAWDVAVARITHSDEAREREHLLLGYQTLHDYPVLLHRHLLDNHAHITGDTGARKTALAIAPMAAQLISAVNKNLESSVVILDLKGEDWLFHTIHDEARHAGRKFRWFTTFPNKSSYVFNPFLQSHWSQLSPEQCSQVILQALSLDYGLGYGRGFFSAMNETVLLALLREYEIKSFRDLYRELEDSTAHTAAGGRSNDWRDARHLTALVNRLAAAHALNLTEADLEAKPEAWREAIDMPSLFDEPQVVYFHLPSPVEPIGAPSIAKLALYSLFTAAAQRTGKPKRVYVFIDEFQQVISDSIRLILEQARSKGLSLILSHQTAGQLDRNGSDLTETVDACTAFKQVLKASDTRAAKRLVDGSGEAIYETRSVTFVPSASGDITDARVEKFEIGERVGARLEPNTIIEVSADPMASMVRFTEGSAYTQFSGYWTTISSEYHQSDDEFQARERRDWPAESGETVPVLAEQVSLSTAAAKQRAKRRTVTVGEGDADGDDAPDVVRFDDWEEKLRRQPPG